MQSFAYPFPLLETLYERLHGLSRRLGNNKQVPFHTTTQLQFYLVTFCDSIFYLLY
jgi:hypothetical protein